MWPFFIDYPLHGAKLLIGFKIILQFLLPDDRLLAFEYPLFGTPCAILLDTIQKPNKADGSVHGQFLPSCG